MRHDPERVRGLVEIRRPETVGELMQFLKVANWMRLPLPNMAEVVLPLRELLERKLKGVTRPKRVASRKVISEEDWSKEIQAAWQSSRELVEDAVQLNFCKWQPVEVMFKDVAIFLVRKLKQIRLRKRVKNALRQRYGIKSERRMNIWGRFCCDQCIYGSILDVLKRGFKEYMQRASSSFPSRKSLKFVTVEFGFALTTAMELGLSWTSIALFSF